MRIGVLVPTRGVVMESARRPPVEECWAMARQADAAGYDAIWVGDSIVAKPRLEPLTTLAYMAGITGRVRLGTAVLLPALRHPVVLAHEIANVDQVSRGRVVLGLGVGWSLPSAEREWAACGADHKRRVRRLEQHIEIWRMLWRGTMGLGPKDVVIEALQRYATAGVTDLCVRFIGDDQQAQLERFTAEVLPRLRS